jgi:uncharacterized protein involved in outer membrane biogenesis
MKTFFKIIVILLLLLTGTIVYVVMFRVGPRVEHAIETILPKALGTEVNIGSMTIRPLHGSVQLHNLTIANPEDFSNPNIAEAKELTFIISLRSLLTDTLVLKEIEINAPTFNYEHRFRANNIESIHHNVTAYLAKRKAEKSELETQDARKKLARKVIIERFVLTDGHVNAKFAALPTAPIPLSTIQLNDIGKETDGTSWGHVGRTIGDSISAAVLDTVSNVRDATRIAIRGTGRAVVGTKNTIMNTADGAGKIVIDDTSKAGGAVLDTATDTGGAVIDTASDAGSTVKQSITDAVKSFGDLFRKKD